jgi:hypothetical protein
VQAPSPGVRDGGVQGGWRVRVTARRQRLAPVRPYAEAAGQAAAPHDDETPATPATYGAAPFRRPSKPPGCCPRSLHEPGWGRSARRAEGGP